MRVALDGLRVPVVGHVSVEMQMEARRVVEAFFPDTTFVENVGQVDEAMVRDWSLKYGSVGLVLVGSGPPCQGVSGLNSDRRGALRDHRSKLFHHVPRIVTLVRKFFPWCQVHNLTENVASMDSKDCEVMCESFEDKPWLVDASGISLAFRPRLFWVTWEIDDGGDEGVWVKRDVEHRLPLQGQVELRTSLDEKDFLEPGWKRQPGQTLPTFTTSRPSPHPMRKPAGLQSCLEHEISRWKKDSHRFPPYQYRDIYCLHKVGEEPRVPSILEREVILGFPPNYTKQCMSKQHHDRQEHRDCRLTLLGNPWCVQVVRFTPGKSSSLQGLLLRPPLSQSTSTLPLSSTLPQKLFGLTSLKGEDLLIQGDSNV